MVPIKRLLSREYITPLRVFNLPRLQFFLLYSPNVIVVHTTPVASSSLVSVLTAPGTHQDLGQSRIDNSFCPFRFSADQKVFGTMSCPKVIQSLWLLTNHVLVHDMGSKDDNNIPRAERFPIDLGGLTNHVSGSPFRPGYYENNFSSLNGTLSLIM